ncbi:MAG: NADH-quinone oxidoreductase subunit L [Bacteroidota bacterium]|nr:MAG: NADH-quinone oxidoreductase subunit L [Bacteroidota bacterium]
MNAVQYLWLVPLLPLLGAVLLIVAGRNMSKPIIASIGAGSVGLSALTVIVIGVAFLSNPDVYEISVWQWIAVGNLTPSIELHLDALSLMFIFVITFVGFLIHLYSVEFMGEDSGYARFFACLNLFVCSMLLLVLAGNLVLLYLGWEGVGLCSYLLIGFWYEDPKNGYAARKAFIITRVGDTAMLIGLFLLFATFNSLDIETILSAAPSRWEQGSSIATVAALLLLGGAAGKSAQLPLQNWLPDAMAGPTPVSALIHAATMVTAGVYLIARMNVLFELSPVAMTTVGVVGAVTLLIAGFSAMTQTDLKRVLAYSTISQIGYMFLALGVGAWSAAIFHFFTHAFFKALLFLGAGAIIEALHHEHNIFRMGGLRKQLPIVFITFLAGAASLAALPLVTSGFYSKDMILWYAWAGEKGSGLLFIAGLVGALVTALYTTRLVIVTFFGYANTRVSKRPGWRMTMPLGVLAALSVVVGFLEVPHNFWHAQLISGFLGGVLPAAVIDSGIEAYEWALQLLAAVVTLGGIFIGYFVYMATPGLHELVKKKFPTLHQLMYDGWGFDALYTLLFVKPVTWLARASRGDVIDGIYTGIAWVAIAANRAIATTQNGVMRWYVLGIVVGALLIITLGILV